MADFIRAKVVTGSGDLQKDALISQIVAIVLSTRIQKIIDLGANFNIQTADPMTVGEEAAIDAVLAAHNHVIGAIVPSDESIQCKFELVASPEVDNVVTVSAVCRDFASGSRLANAEFQATVINFDTLQLKSASEYSFVVTKGVVLSQNGQAAIYAQTDANGEFEFTLTDVEGAADETIQVEFQSTVPASGLGLVSIVFDDQGENPVGAGQLEGGDIILTDLSPITITGLVEASDGQFQIVDTGGQGILGFNEVFQRPAPVNYRVFERQNGPTDFDWIFFNRDLNGGSGAWQMSPARSQSMTSITNGQSTPGGAFDQFSISNRIIYTDGVGPDVGETGYTVAYTDITISGLIAWLDSGVGYSTLGLSIANNVTGTIGDTSPAPAPVGTAIANSSVGDTEKVYYEFEYNAVLASDGVTVANATDARIGFINSAYSTADIDTALGEGDWGWGVSCADGQVYLNSVGTAIGGAALNSGDVLAMAIDASTGQVWIGTANGGSTTWWNAGDPANGLNESFTVSGLVYRAAFGNQDAAAYVTVDGSQAIVGLMPAGFVDATVV